jgi:hypothetical protein
MQEKKIEPSLSLSLSLSVSKINFGRKDRFGSLQKHRVNVFPLFEGVVFIGAGQLRVQRWRNKKNTERGKGGRG